jgi:hypothetical protein
MTTRIRISVDYGMVRVTKHWSVIDLDGNNTLHNGEGRLLKQGEADDFTISGGEAFSVEELPAVSESDAALARAKEPLHEGEVLSPHEVYAQPVKQSEL